MLSRSTGTARRSDGNLSEVKYAARVRRNFIQNGFERMMSMLYFIAAVLLTLWLLGLITSYTMGGFIHLLLVLAVIVVLVNIISGRRLA